MTRVLGRPILATLIALLTVALARAGEEPVFSGPQPGEKLPGFSMKGVLGDDAGKQIDLVAPARRQARADCFLPRAHTSRLRPDEHDYSFCRQSRERWSGQRCVFPDG